MRSKAKTMFLRGTPISDGLVVGRTSLLSAQSTVSRSGIVIISADSEWNKYNHAKKRALEQVAVIAANLNAAQQSLVASQSAELMDCYQQLLNDEVLIEKIKTNVFEGALDATTAIVQAFKDVRDVVASMQNEHIRDKIFDLDACEDMLLSELAGAVPSKESLRNELNGLVIVLKHAGPQDIINLHKAGVAGIIAESGSKLSHAALLARSFNIPTVFGVQGVTGSIPPNQQIILDATKGELCLNPSRSELRKAEARKAVSLMLQQKLKAGSQTIARTIDGQRVLVFANAETEIDSRFYQSTGAEGIGLLRTEFLYLQTGNTSHPPFQATEEQLKVYFHSVAEASAQRWVTVRLLDCGGDKPYPSGIKFNPAVQPDSTQGVFGLRGIRFLLKEQSILRTQLTSLIRANTFGNLRVLIPFVTDVSEVRAVKEEMLLIWENMTDAEKSTTHFPSVGAMIETPASLLTLQFIANECDFISVGSNDLAQHVLCRDRGHAHDDEPFSFYHPALLRCLRMIFDHQKEQEMALSLCGEIASDPLATELLIGLGCMHLSARPNAIPLIKEIIRSIDTGDARKFAESLLCMDSSDAIEQQLRARFEEQHGSDFFSPAATHRAS